MLGHRQIRWINIEATLVSRPVGLIAVDAGVEESCMRLVSVGVVLSQRRTQLTGIEPAMGCDSGPPLNRNWVVGLHDGRAGIEWMLART